MLESGASAQTVDTRVRGKDRPLEVKLDSVVQMLDEQVRLRRQHLQKEDQHRYKKFRSLLTFTTTAGCVLTLAMLGILMRRHPGA